MASIGRHQPRYDAGYVLVTSREMLSAAVPVGSGECNIKGNASINTGEHIYHVPGKRYCAATQIELSHGERYLQ